MPFRPHSNSASRLSVTDFPHYAHKEQQQFCAPQQKLCKSILSTSCGGQTFHIKAAILSGNTAAIMQEHTFHILCFADFPQQGSNSARAPPRQLCKSILSASRGGQTFHSKAAILSLSVCTPVKTGPESRTLYTPN